ncbi:Nitronate monooxygenase [Corynebacterium occultum]|uniref:Propionate 3-nitronate monooxygenase n=2 Tax=Corynebacterium occultum TaxID=2675219 RepID=A0A6B8VMT0_9CORY|nr:Nitronate monooxygenase [Corynebacterium occultum]
MAGGPSTPALAKAVTAGGGLGFLTAGTMSVTQLQEELDQMEGIYALNLFAPQKPLPDLTEVEEVRQQLIPVYRAADLGEPQLPQVDYSNGWEEKFTAALNAEHRPAVLSATFGTFAPEEIETLHEAGIEAWVTITNPEDAAAAARAGADALVVQGPEAGGHRSTWAVADIPDSRSLPRLLHDVAKLNLGIPLIAAGGISTPGQVAETLTLPGVVAVSCGTAFLLAEEAGTSDFNREILAHTPDTVSTRAFSGRVARGVLNTYTQAHPDTPAIYPYLNPLLKPLRGKQDFAYCLAGIGAAHSQPGSAAEILAHLVGDIPPLPPT